MLKEIVLGRNKSVNICIRKVQVKGEKKGHKWTKMKYLKKTKSFKENSENDKIWKMLKYYCLFSRA